MRKNGFTDRIAMVENCYPINLLRSVLYLVDDDEEVHDIWDYDIRQFRDYVQRLPDREAKVIDLRYRYGMTLSETAVTMGVTHERIRQIQTKAERKLRNWCHRDGIFIVRAKDYMDLKEENSKLRAQLDAYRAVETREEPETQEMPHTRIEDMDFNVRCYNCLKRAGINTLNDILEFDQNQGNEDERFYYKSWLHIRNLGRKSLIDIARVVYDYCGYRLSLWEDAIGYVAHVVEFNNEEMEEKSNAEDHI